MDITFAQGKSFRYDDEYADLLPDWLDIMKDVTMGFDHYEPLKRGEGFALFVLSSSENGLSAGELGEAMGVTTGRMANILRQLAKKGYVERDIQLTDHRKTRITLTEGGKAHLAKLFDDINCHVLYIFHRLGRHDSEELLRIMRKLSATKTDNA